MSDFEPIVTGHTPVIHTDKSLIAAQTGRIKELETQLAAAKQADSWLPIESAPKDGTWIFVRYGELWHHISVVHWNERNQFWLDKDQRSYSLPTIWQPLPAPPKDET